jgi:glycosyltransferase 2 family protein
MDALLGPWLRHVVVGALTVALVMAFLRNATLGDVWRVVATARWSLVGAGVVCLFATYLLRAARWQVMLRPLGRARLLPAFRATVIGFAASFVLPARAGEVIRPWILARHEGLDAAAVFATIVLERMLDLVAVLLLLGLYLTFFDTGLAARDPAMFEAVRAGGLLAAGAAVGGLAVLLASARHPATLARAIGWLTAWLPSRLRGVVASLTDAFVAGLAVVHEPRTLGVSMAWSLLLWLVIAVQIWVVSVGVGVALPPAGALLIMAMLVVGVAVPTPGAVGGFHEAYRLGATAFFGAANDHAVGAAIVLHAVGFVPTLIAGAWLMAREGLSLTHLGRAVERAKDEEIRR